MRDEAELAPGEDLPGGGRVEGDFGPQARLPVGVEDRLAALQPGRLGERLGPQQRIARRGPQRERGRGHPVVGELVRGQRVQGEGLREHDQLGQARLGQGPVADPGRDAPVGDVGASGGAKGGHREGNCKPRFT